MSGRFAAIGRAVQETLTQRNGKPVLMNFDGATRTAATDSTWTNLTTTNCDTSRPLFCFMQ